MPDNDTPPPEIPPRVAPAPPHVLWLWHLFTQPQRFFSHVATSTRLTVVYATWVYGMAQMIEWIPGLAKRSNWISGVVDLSFMLDSWLAYGLSCLVGGVIAGAITYSLGGWWYCTRLRLSGVGALNEAMARRVYVFSGLVWALPALLVALRIVGLFDTPLAAEQGSVTWQALAIPGAARLWSVYVSYCGVKTVFAATSWKARLWFALLPMGLYLCVATLIVVAAIMPMFVSSPQVDSPLSWDRPAFTLDYPSNWQVDEVAEDFDPDSNISIIPCNGAIVVLHVSEGITNEDDEVDLCIERYEKAMDTSQQPVTFDRWGAHDGTGRTLVGTLDGEPFRIQVFTCSHDDTFMVITECAAERLWDTLLPGFELIRHSFAFSK